MKPFSEKSWHFSPHSKSSIFWVGYLLQWNHSLKNPCISHHLQNLSFLGRLPITVKPFYIKPFWEILAFLTPSKLFSSGQVAHYNKTTLKNLCIFHHFEKSLHFSTLWKISAFFTTLKNLHVFHLGRSPITTRSLWKISVFFTTLKNICVFHLGRSPITTRPPWKIFAFFTIFRNLHISHHFGNFCVFEKSLYFSSLFTWAGRPLQQDHFEKNLCIFHHFEKFSHFSPLWKILVFLTTWKNLRVFHLGRSPITMRPPLWKKHCIFHLCKKLFAFFTWVGHPLQWYHSTPFPFG